MRKTFKNVLDDRYTFIFVNKYPFRKRSDIVYHILDDMFFNIHKSQTKAVPPVPECIFPTTVSARRILQSSLY